MDDFLHLGLILYFGSVNGLCLGAIACCDHCGASVECV
jgi:hypothetical protein